MGLIMWSLFLIGHLVFYRFMTRLVVNNMHQNDMSQDETRLHCTCDIDIILGSIRSDS